MHSCTYTHTYVHTQIRRISCIHAYTNIRTKAALHRYATPQKHLYIHTYTYILRRPSKHIRTHKHSHIHTVHTHTYVLSWRRNNTCRSTRMDIQKYRHTYRWPTTCCLYTHVYTQYKYNNILVCSISATVCVMYSQCLAIFSVSQFSFAFVCISLFFFGVSLILDVSKLDSLWYSNLFMVYFHFI